MIFNNYINYLAKKMPMSLMSISKVVSLFFFLVLSRVFYRYFLSKIIFFFIGNLRKNSKKIVIENIFIKFFFFMADHRKKHIFIKYIYILFKFLAGIYFLIKIFSENLIDLENLWYLVFCVTSLDMLFYILEINSIFSQYIIFYLYDDYRNNAYYFSLSGYHKISSYILYKIILNTNKNNYLDGNYSKLLYSRNISLVKQDIYKINKNA
ncbi:MAG: hypothetical protein EOP33_06420 [Rickettsiaceae bacterium]|nr:MAG: hypothetical protein EOP33_06420 [Rickettsiaceae bacterium]